ncbi:MAG: class I SAM-dependent methyltransferase [Candidatus Abyssobacteria bacterium SURF_5]|uniref:Class I SAM-dependent methyltransferase n=1 Tax=Abyssobacteria bacterium (strain SURF_5) TaxID=2093360 RepID=A0A3A4NTF4_ABYX5|nr:MAG: class I SAM-dependent methyltransferase [Candidatus Abyssubacteria bacterium SURF_5]
MTSSYYESCRSDFWKRVFQQEVDYLRRELAGCKNLLSVGCGPAIIEGMLGHYGFDVTGLDISQEALNQAPDQVRTVLGSAEQTNIESSSFDAIIYVASLQFIDNYSEALRESERILRPGGTILVMLLNPESFFFKQKRRDPESYVNKIRHVNLKAIEQAISQIFALEKTEYFLGIRGPELFKSADPAHSSLYCVKAKKRI